MEKLKVIILEDDAVISLHISQILSQLGCELINVVTNFDDAILCASKNKVDLLIADIKIIGDIDGIDTAKSIQDNYNCEVLFLTAHIDNITLNRASQINALGYLVKPFRENELKAILTMAIQRKSEKKELSISISNNYNYNLNENKLYCDNTLVSLTNNEAKLFNLLVNSINNIVSYESINEILWYNKPVSDSNRRQLIFKLKQKLPDVNIKVFQNEGISLNC